MKLLVFAYHFILSNLLPGIFFFLILDGVARYVVSGVWVFGWLLSYIFIDKLILFFLGAREIIDQDSQELFQQMKSESYKNYETEPKIYLYGGNAPKCFVLESRGEWSVVLERSLEENLDTEQIRAFADYIMRFKAADVAWRLTKSHGLAALALGLNYSFLSKVMMLSPESKAFKVANFFSLTLLKPFLDGALFAGRTTLGLDVDASLEALVNVDRDYEPGLGFSEFLLENLQRTVSPKELMVRRLEKFPVLERAVFKRSF